MERKQIPQVVENVVNSKHRMERLESLGLLAKQVLSQLSYTPPVSVILLSSIPVAGVFRVTTNSPLLGTFGTTSLGKTKTVADTLGFGEPNWEVFFKRRIQFTHVLRLVGEPELPQVFLTPLGWCP